MKVTAQRCFRVTRELDLALDDAGKAPEPELSSRASGTGIRLQVAADAPGELINSLRARFRLESAEVHPVAGPLDLPGCTSLGSAIRRPPTRIFVRRGHEAWERRPLQEGPD
jgi:polyphosphate kinase